MSDGQLKSVWCCVTCADERRLADMVSWRPGWTQTHYGENVYIMICPHLATVEQGLPRQSLVAW